MESVPTFLPVHSLRKIFGAGLALRILHSAKPDLFSAHQDLATSLNQVEVQVGINKSSLAWRDVESNPVNVPQVDRDDTIAANHEPASRPELLPLGFELFDIFSHTPDDSLESSEFPRFIQLLISTSDQEADLLPSSTKTLKSFVNRSFVEPLFQASLNILTPIRSIFINDLKLEAHLDILYRFMLLGDDAFTRLLSTTLYEPSQGLDLKVGVSTVWPPTTTLTVALQRVLNEAIEQSKEASTPDEAVWHDLEDRLSFSIVSAAEQAYNPLCKYQSILHVKRSLIRSAAIEALDFLCMSYKPPLGLNSIISYSSVNQYNRIFHQVLRISRAQYVLQFVRRKLKERTFLPSDLDSQRLLYATSFIATNTIEILSSYTRSRIIYHTWTKFLADLQTLDGIEDMERAHAQALDYMHHALMLKKRQSKLYGYIKTIFNVVFYLGSLFRQDIPVESKTLTKRAAELRHSIQNLVCRVFNLSNMD